MNLSWRQSGTYKRLAGPNLFNWRLFWWSYLILFIPQILFDVIAWGSPSWLWLQIWTSSHLAATALVIVAKALGFDRFQEKHPSALANLVLAALAGIVRVVWVGEFSYLEGLIAEFNLPTRVGSGIVLGLLLFISITNVLEINKSYNQALRALLRTQNQLNNLRKLAGKNFAQSQLEISRESNRVIEPRLAEIARLLKRQDLSAKLRNNVTRDLKDILENQVKPLNKNLRLVGAAYKKAELHKAVSRSTLFRIPPLVQADLAISPFWLLVLFLGVIPFSLYIFEGENWATLGVVISIVNYAIIWVTREYFRRQALVPLTTAIAQYLLLILELVIFDYAVLLWAGFPDDSAPFVALMTLITLIFTISAVGIEAVQEHNRSDFLAQIAKNNSRIERELGLLNQRAWVEKRRWALTIHGTVQASLTAALARLNQKERLDANELKRIAEHVLQAKRGLSGPGEKVFDLKQAIREQQKTWDGIMKVSVATKSPHFLTLASDLWAGFCANEIIKEGLGNAFRHGQAKHVSVKFETEKPGFVTIEITNDGKSPNKKTRTGLGSQLLSEIAHPWSINKNPNGGGVLKAQLPVSKARTKFS